MSLGQRPRISTRRSRTHPWEAGIRDQALRSWGHWHHEATEAFARPGSACPRSDGKARSGGTAALSQTPPSLRDRRGASAADLQQHQRPRGRRTGSARTPSGAKRAASPPWAVGDLKQLLFPLCFANLAVFFPTSSCAGRVPPSEPRRPRARQSQHAGGADGVSCTPALALSFLSGIN